MAFCQTTGKIIHGSAHEAGKALGNAKRRHDDGIERHPFYCQHCEGWHFGTKMTTGIKPYKRRRQR